jgi:Ni/Co efflux regulator RcnB
MKRFALAGAAALMLAGPLASFASAQDFGGRQSGPSRVYARGDNDRAADRRDNDRRDDSRADRRDNDRRDNDRRFDQRRHNSYYVNGRYYRGAPPAWAQARRDYRPAYTQWRRGERLPSYYRSQYREVDWRRSHYRQPPRGYHYVRDDNTGEVLLVAVATGLILSILLSQ